jgi:hypothetical protein
MDVRKVRCAAVATIVGGVLALGSASAAHDDVIIVDDGVVDNAKATHGHHSQHGGEEGHLPAGSSNVRVVGKSTVGHIGEGRVADVGVHNGFAYLTAFRDPACKQGGVYVVDIQDPTDPTQVAFINTSKQTYAGEGSQAITLDTPHFQGDVLAFNNEICGDAKQANGGMTLVDVTDPTEPHKLVSHAGDLKPSGKANEIHSVFMWTSGAKAYAVLVDNEEFTDVDIMDITDPRNPVMVREYDLAAEFPQIVQADAGLDSVFHHDMIVKEIDGRQIMLVSYWDGGYVTLDVTDPANATYVGDSDFADPDSGAQEFGLTVAPEGNAHQAEFTRDNEYIIAADEDFGPYKSKSLNVSKGTSFQSTDGDATPTLEPGTAHDFQTVFVGTACPTGSPAVPAATATGQIAVVERGICSFTEKVATVEAAGGYEAVLVFNREGDDAGACSDLVNMQVSGNIPAMFVGRDVGLDLFDVTYDDAACRDTSVQESGIPIGTPGDVVRFESVFDGWGYVRLFDNAAGKLTELDTYAVPEAFDPEKADDSGDLSVHEIATSQARDDLAYVSYYAAGLRIIDVEDGEISEVGHFIDEGGNNFWGVQVFEHEGKEYVAASDRDYGIYIFEYTGP